MRIGTMFLGRVDALEQESIQTKFFVLGVPLAPIESYYVLGEHMNGVDGIELPMVHGKSALFGYLRIFTGLGAVLSGVFAYIDHGDVSLWALCAVCALAWVASMFFLGGVAPQERERRLALRRYAGIGAPPELLDGSRRENIQIRLEGLWRGLVNELGRDDVSEWRALLDTPSRAPRGTEELLYALARYDGEEQRAAALWTATHG